MYRDLSKKLTQIPSAGQDVTRTSNMDLKEIEEQLSQKANK
jgi:hypothetical protein